MNELTITKGWEDLKIFEQDKDAWVSSRNIAEIFEKNHQHILEKIHEILKNPDNFTHGIFRQSFYINKQNKKQPEYLLNRKSFALVVMGFTGEKALKFKKDYINAFESMYELIQTRILSKMGYREMTLSIKENIDNKNDYTYAIESNMINQIILGMTAKQFREINGIDDYESIRDNILLEKLEKLNNAQLLNSQLIKAKLNYETRKTILLCNFSKENK